MTKQTKKQTDWEGWIIGGFLVLPIIFFGVLGSHFGWFDGSKSSSAPETSDSSTVLGDAARDINDTYSELLDAAQTMAADVDTQCVWLDDNISSGVAEYCSDALEYYGDINTADGSIVEALDYDDGDTRLENAIQQMVDDGNLKYNELLEKAQSMSDTMDEECSWLYDNISSDVADHCNDTTYDFRHSDFSSDPFSTSDYT